MSEHKELDQKIEQAFQGEADAPPGDKYFKKIWDSIESRAPVGERYYLRSFFTIFFLMLLIVVFILFYSDFLSSIVTLREIQKENIRNSRFTVPIPSITGDMEIVKGVLLTSMLESHIQVKTENNETVELDFYSGHIIVDKRIENKVLILHMPDIKVVMKRGTGKCNIFCYDGIVRIIPLLQPVDVESGGKHETITPPSSYFFTNTFQKSTKKLLMPGVQPLPVL